MAFLQSLPGGSLKISPEQAPAVASYLQSAGLPKEEIDQLLAASSSQEISLNAGDLQAAWQRAQEQGAASAAASGQSTPLASANQPQEAPEIQQTPGYRALWERLTLPQNMLPTLRLAMARLGASPEVLAQLEEKGQGQGVSLTKVWQVLQNVKDSLTPSGAGDPSGAALTADASQSAVLGARPVTGAEMEEWRQVLLKAGLQPEVVEKLLGQKSPGTQEELKTSLLAAAPAEEPPPILAEPKPLYHPQNLQMRPFFWQSQHGGDQPQLNGDGSGAKGQSASAQAATPAPASATGENFALSTFPAELQGITLRGGGTAPLSDTGATWRLMSPEVRESLWTQLQSGVTSNLSQGENQVTLNLNPPQLGQIQLTLNLSGQELAVTAVASRPEAAELASLGMPQLVQALAQQGLVLTQFQVHVQDQSERPVSPILAGDREKGGENGRNSTTSSRRRSGEVDRFV
jgi:flagellar hook-length control protein FliK